MEETTPAHTLVHILEGQNLVQSLSDEQHQQEELIDSGIGLDSSQQENEIIHVDNNTNNQHDAKYPKCTTPTCNSTKIYNKGQGICRSCYELQIRNKRKSEKIAEKLSATPVNKKGRLVLSEPVILQLKKFCADNNMPLTELLERCCSNLTLLVEPDLNVTELVELRRKCTQLESTIETLQQRNQQLQERVWCREHKTNYQKAERTTRYEMLTELKDCITKIFDSKNMEEDISTNESITLGCAHFFERNIKLFERVYETIQTLQSRVQSQSQPATLTAALNAQSINNLTPLALQNCTIPLQLPSAIPLPPSMNRIMPINMSLNVNNQMFSSLQ